MSYTAISTLLMLVVVSSIWMYWDASSKKIGKVEGVEGIKKGLGNTSALVWAISCMLLWIIVLPLYLSKRKGLIQTAQDHPVEETSRVAKTVLLVFIGLGVVGTAIPRPAKLPKCTAPETSKLIAQIVDARISDPNKKFKALQDIKQTSYDKKAQARLCTAQFVPVAGAKIPVRFQLTWQDRDAGQFSVVVAPVAAQPTAQPAPSKSP